MKKIFAILISLLFIVSVFGVASVMAPPPPPLTATPEKIKDGEIITVTSYLDPCDFEDHICYDPTIKIYDPSIKDIVHYPIIKDSDFEKFQDASLYVTKVSGPLKTDGENIWTWTYRANQAGTIVFGAPAFPSSPPEYRAITNPVTITKASYPMNKFMKILGFGNKD